MKVLFSALHFGNYRNFESAIRELAARGHQVHLLADEEEHVGGQALVERLAADSPSITWGWTPSPVKEPWFPVAQKLRFALDYVRFLDPKYAAAAKLRIRNIERTPRVVRWLTSGVGGALVGHRAVARGIRWVERAMPHSEGIARMLDERRPDVLLLASLTFSRSFAMDQLKAARVLRIPTAACVMSWDHLSSKALLHVPPDMTLVWNDVQKREAVEMHGIGAESVVVTGAQCYDQWFDRRPARSREEFCRAVGLDPAKPIVLYVCSAMSPVPDPVEPVFVKQWIEALRSSEDPTLRAAGILVRPHPERVREWSGVSLDDLQNVVVHGRTPIDADAKADYFDSLYYSSAVVGLCTSVFLEAAIVGRPVLTLLLPAYRMHQDGMAHFRYLRSVAGGLLETAPDVLAHIAQLGAAIRRSDGERDERNLRFIAEFIRPHGLETLATPVFVDAVERLAMVKPAESRAGSDRRSALTGVVERMAIAGTSGVGEWLMMDHVDEERRQSERERAVAKNEIRDARETYRLEKARAAGKIARERQFQQRAKQRARWRRSFNPRKQVARLKGGLKVLLGVRQQ